MISIDTTIKTKNYQLRIPDENDIDFVFSATRFKGFNDGMQWEAPRDRAELFKAVANNRASWMNGTAYNFTIESISPSQTKLGRISISKTEEEDVWHVGYWTHPAHQKKGIMTEVLEGVLAFGFNTLRAIKIRSRYATWNKASEKVLINNGFKFVEHIDKGFKKRNRWISENELSITVAQWEESRSPKPREKECAFCNTVKISNNKIFETDRFVALLDIDPIAIGHIIICPKDHYSDFHNLPDKLLAEMMVLAKAYVKVLRELFTTEGYSMMINGGAFNDLNHFHLHVFPRKSETAFQWSYDEHIHRDALRFDVIKKFLEGYVNPLDDMKNDY